ncbi:TITAN-like protein [Phytophthora citrophthora]|uniref:TITAN-like protein n=1 Tax=Phytophthora citrophthora TaxID=4793 RepID=A0AAD9LL96_9STRA|nr:TITAN-like protein [Phytophthora citrophthora]
MADDAVEAPYCVVCRRSSACKWRKHVFSRGHQQATQPFLLHHVSRIQALLDASTSGSLDSWRCVFCDAALATEDALTHLGSETHRKQVETFCRHHRCDADRQLRPQLWINAVQRREVCCRRATNSRLFPCTEQLETKVEKREIKQEKQEIVDHTGTDRQAFLTSAALRLQEVASDRRRVVENSVEVKQEELLGPQVAADTKQYKTVSSAEGVLQNPLGRHEGKRVWGGGVVKLRKHEWIPWTIDQLVKEEQTGQPETQQTGVDDSPFAHRVTELAKGEGLSSIASISWGECVGNVHTSAVPPWMVQTEEEYKQCNRREQAARPPPIRATYKAEGKRRDIFSELQSKSEYGPDWLPNFGGVWQDGPRSKTKQAFRKVAPAYSSRERAPNKTAETSSSQLDVLAPAEVLPPVKAPLEACAPQSSTLGVPAITQREETTSMPAEKPTSKASNPLDAKKQLLLAQKERLRAKMAARRHK